MVEIKDLNFSYPYSTEILKNIDFTIPDGEVVGVFGRNGTGKTTLLKLISGLLVPEKGGGTVTIDGESPHSADISYISESGTYINFLSPYEYGNFLSDFFKKFDLEKYSHMLQKFEVPNIPCKKMSRGEKSKVEACAGLCKNSKYLIVDEPFEGKDIVARDSFLELLSEGITGEETVFITTHDINQIENFVDRVLLIKEKHIVENISVDNLKGNGQSIKDLFLKY